MLEIGAHRRRQRGARGRRRAERVRRLVADGRIKPHETVVLFNTGGALKYLDSPCERGTGTPQISSGRYSPNEMPIARGRREQVVVQRYGRGLPHHIGERYRHDVGRIVRDHLAEDRRASSSTALPPKRVASTRSNAVGAPPRCRWPSTTERVSLPVISLERRGHLRADAAQPLDVSGRCACSSSVADPPIGLRALRRPRRC